MEKTLSVYGNTVQLRFSWLKALWV